jgi:hypothetical protein
MSRWDGTPLAARGDYLTLDGLAYWPTVRTPMSNSMNGRSRLRFDSLEQVTTPDGSARVAVRLEWRGDMFEGEVPCLQTQQGILRAAAQSTVAATLASTSEVENPTIRLEIVGVKAVRAFDGWVVVARINGTAGSETYRLLGAAPCEREEDLPAAAVKAVLNASNRILEQRVAR